MKKTIIYLPLFILISITGVNSQQKGKQIMSKQSLEVATLGGGCFWCVEAVYERVKGVQNVVSGYAGGHLKDPTSKMFPEETRVMQKYVKSILIRLLSAMIKFWIFSGKPMTPPP
jgi:hypothetical protein